MPLQLFLEQVNLEGITAKTRKERPSDIIFLCGGNGTQSIRFHLEKYLKKSLLVFKAEEVIDWKNSAIFQGDLLELEKYIAALAGIIVLIPESAGSIAELGSFVNDKEIRKKLLVVIERKYRRSSSFICDGLLANLAQEPSENSDEGQNSHLCVIEDIPVEVHGEDKDWQDLGSTFSDIQRSIASFHVSGGKISLLDSYYQALFVLDLIILALVLSKKELYQCLNGIKKRYESENIFSKKSVERILLLLEKLALVHKEERGQDIYFVPRVKGTFLKYTYQSSKTEINTSGVLEQSREEIRTSAKKMKLWEEYGPKSFSPVLSTEQIIRKAPFLYKVFDIPKKHGGFREIAQPTRELKNIQRERIAELQAIFPIHAAAVAYRQGINGVFQNAWLHKDNNFFLKLDFNDFFHSIYASDFNLLLDKKQEISESKRVEFLKIFFMFNKRENIKQNTRIIRFFVNEQHTDALILRKIVSPTYKSRFRLSIGAPSSPMLSNMFMFNFDKQVYEWALKYGITYSRYADDLTFSSKTRDSLESVSQFVNDVLKSFKEYSHLSLNTAKTKELSFAKRVTITGLNITPEHKISIGREQKKKIRAMLHAVETKQFDYSQVNYLKGWLAYAAEVEPVFVQSIEKSFAGAIVQLSNL